MYAVENRLAPEWKAFTQLDEYTAVVDALQGFFGCERGVSPKHVFGGGDRDVEILTIIRSTLVRSSFSAGGNMTAAISLRRRDERKPNIAWILADDGLE